MEDADNEHYEWASGSMKDLAQRMDDIDKQLEAIVDTTEDPPKSRDSTPIKESRQHSDEETPRNPANDVNIMQGFDDDDDDDDDDDEASERDYDLALDDLQSELNQINAETVAATMTSPRNEDVDPATGSTPGWVEMSVSATVTKPSISSPVGISMKTIKGVTRITAIKLGGLLQDTSLEPGFEILKINGIVIKNAKHARYLIQEASGKVIIDTQMLVRDDETDGNNDGNV